MRDTFVDVPFYADEPLLCARNEDEYNFYIEWLADYLYRPGRDFSAPLSEDEACSQILGIEYEIACRFMDEPFDDYPREDELPSNGARHVDILHREEICIVLSRVPDRARRVWLLRRFYREVMRDFHK